MEETNAVLPEEVHEHMDDGVALVVGTALGIGCEYATINDPESGDSWVVLYHADGPSPFPVRGEVPVYAHFEGVEWPGEFEANKVAARTNHEAMANALRFMTEKAITEVAAEMGVDA